MNKQKEKEKEVKCQRKRIYSTKAQGSGEDTTHSMEDKIPVAEFQTAKRHGHPALDVRGEKDERTVLDDHFEIGVEEFKDEVQIRL